MKGDPRVWRLRLIGWRILYWRAELLVILAYGAFACLGLWEWHK